MGLDLGGLNHTLHSVTRPYGRAQGVNPLGRGQVSLRNPDKGASLSEIINLNHARKAKARKDSRSEAAQNRAKFGRTKADKTLEAAQAEKAARALDQAKRED
jgi:hypothetical protein